MAIVEMKRISLLASAADEKVLTQAMQHMGCVHLIRDEEADGFTRQMNVPDGNRIQDQITRLKWAIDRLGTFATQKKALFADKPTISFRKAEQLLNEEHEQLFETVTALEETERRIGEIRGAVARIDSSLEQLIPWKNLSIPIEQVKDTPFTGTILGSIPTRGWAAMQQEIDPLCEVYPIGVVRDQTYICVLVHTDMKDDILQQLKAADFVPIKLDGFSGTVEQEILRLRKEKEELNRRIDEESAHMGDFVCDLDQLKYLHDTLCTQREQIAASEQVLHSAQTFYLRGWVPAGVTDALEKKIHAISPSACIEFADPEKEDDVPVLLQNSPVATPYESVVTGFSLPDYHGLDPTAIMMAFFANFMGMMVSDAGYGLLLVLFIPVILKLFKPARGTRNLMWILFGGGIATVIWGALYNTWFGFSPWPSVFDPINKAMPVMGVCVGLGAIHLFTGLGVAAYMNCKRGKPLSAVADQLSWFLLILGMIIMVLPMFAPQISQSFINVGKYLALVGAAIILVTAGREKSRNPFKRLISGLGALYGITGWVSDLLSYMRLFGMGLATGVIGMVFNQLVGMVTATGAIGWVIGAVLFVFCHLFNMAINVLGAYVHSCRLQYIEFFGKFYEDGGKPFKPITTAGRYCYIRDDQ